MNYIYENTFLGGVIGCISKTAGDSGQSATFLNMENWRSGRGIGIAGSIDANTNVVWSIYEATAAAGTSSAAISGKTTYHGATGDNTVKQIQFDVNDLTAGYSFVGLGYSVSGGTSALLGGLIELCEPRYAQGTTAAT